MDKYQGRKQLNHNCLGRATEQLNAVVSGLNPNTSCVVLAQPGTSNIFFSNNIEYISNTISVDIYNRIYMHAFIMENHIHESYCLYDQGQTINF